MWLLIGFVGYCNPIQSPRSTAYMSRSIILAFECHRNIYLVLVLCQVYAWTFLLIVFNKIIIKCDVNVLLLLLDLALRVIIITLLVWVRKLLRLITTIGTTRIATIAVTVIRVIAKSV
jgi:hypothetical protein